MAERILYISYHRTRRDHPLIVYYIFVMFSIYIDYGGFSCIRAALKRWARVSVNAEINMFIKQTRKRAFQRV